MKEKIDNGIKYKCSSVAQQVEQVAVNHWVGGSSPSRGAILFLLTAPFCSMVSKIVFVVFFMNKTILSFLLFSLFLLPHKCLSCSRYYPEYIEKFEIFQGFNFSAASLADRINIRQTVDYLAGAYEDKAPYQKVKNLCDKYYRKATTEGLLNLLLNYYEESISKKPNPSFDEFKNELLELTKKCHNKSLF